MRRSPAVSGADWKSGPDRIVKMPGSVMSVFSEADEFQAALRADGVLNLLVTGHGQFRARLTRVTLDHIHLSAGDEYLARIAFIAMPADTLFVSLPADDQPGLIWNGMEMRAGRCLPSARATRYIRERTGSATGVLSEYRPRSSPNTRAP